jgi:predicted Rossmann-fold nucleotide-binding protein
VPSLSLPYESLRRNVYSPDELFANFSVGDPSSYVRLLDFEIYRHFVAEGRTTPVNYFSAMMQSLHDNSITQSVGSILSGRKCVAIMGGHKLGRSTPQYLDVAKLSSLLTKSGFLVASGGGPGAMEASHLGAACCNEGDAFLPNAVAELSKTADLPSDIAQIVDASGTPNTTIAAAAHKWFAAAMLIRSQIKSPGESLAVPTWHYGHEPTTPFATQIAKYFQNSIREDGLLAIAHDGVVYAQGKAGTIQEIFQDAAQNYYKSFGRFSPMVFLDKTYWTSTYPVESVLKALLKPEDFVKYVLFTDDIVEAHDFLLKGNA